MAMISAEAIRMAELEASDRVEASKRSLEAVSTEIARLRAALRRIADMCPATQELTLAHQIAEEAEAALKGEV